ncbi:MAG: glycosyl hydrolase family 28-related protein [Phycisphaerae bacterium]
MTADAAAPGDRRPPVHQIYPAAVFYHNGKGGRVLDVTQPPFNAKGDGVTDDTPALIAAWRFVRDHYEVLRSGDCTYCTQKLDRNWIIYLPDGEYLLSDTVSQGWPALAMNILKGWSQVQYLRVESPEHEQELYATSPPVPALVHGNPDLPANDDNTGCYIRGQYNSAAVYAENNWAIRVIGQSRAKTIIRLQDAAPGFGAGAKKPVLAFCLLQRGSNVNLGNIIENLTIDTGQGNPGAVGLRWNSSNWGGVRNLAIRSGDGQGRVGLLMDRNNATGYHHDLLIEGFEVGIELAAGRETMVTLEYATLTGQRDTAIQLGNAKAGGGGDSLSARKLLIQYAPVALRAARAGQAILLESELTSRRQNAAALVVEPDGFLMARAVRLSGYRTAVLRHGKAVVDGEFIEEYFSAPPANSNPVAPARPSWLPIKDSPLILPEHDLSKWADVDDFGAVGDGVADDTAAIQRALNSGRPVVYFPKANYVVNGTVDIPATVREITWLFGSFHRSHAVAPDMAAMFRVAESSLEPLLLHQSMSAGGVVLDHDADRPVVLEDMFICHHHCRTYPVLPGPIAQDTTIWRLYRNTRPDGAAKEVFVNDCLFFASAEGGQHAVENVRAWVRFLNNENVPGALHAFRRSDVWIFGFKSEHAETLVHADDYSRLEVLGGSFLNWTSWKGPVVFCRDSQIRIVFLMWHWRKATETILQTERWGAVATLPASRFQKLAMADAAVIAVACD